MHEEMQQFAGGYFHEDYDLDFADPDEAIAAYGEGHSSKAVRGLVADIDALLRSPVTEPELSALWIDELGARYEPTRDGMTYREWFAHVRDLLTSPTSSPSVSSSAAPETDDTDG